MKVSKIILLILLFSGSFFFATDWRETRAVWLTTNFALDWPPNTYDENLQKKSLRKIFEDLSKKKFNTVYFQVRSNGTVLYDSDIEPFSPYFTGETGVKPNYDPLEYALELGKEFNLEIHAWLNMIRCFSGSDERFLKHPNHIRNAHPDWTVRVMTENGKLSYWMNPGYFRVQDYLVDLLLEVSSKYDIDGIHLDFFRYPDKDFEDDKYFKNYGLNVSLEDWRRNNLTTILRKFKDKANPKNPYLKVGATPIGIRKNLNGAVGWEGYSSVFQDTERWLEEELVDYLAPQIYWNFKNNPKFDVLADDWVKNSYSKNIILGLAAYKSDVKEELVEMINYSREIKASGISFFRYENISSTDDQYFNDLRFPSNMEWKQLKTITPEELVSTYKELSDKEVLIGWKNDYEENLLDSRGFALINGDKPIKLLSLEKDKVRLKFGKPSKLMYEYRICKLDRLWNYSSISNIMYVLVPYLENLKNSSFVISDPILFKQNDNTAILAVTSHSNQSALIDIFNIENLGKQQYAELKSGLNLVPIEENLKTIKLVRITYSENNRVEEVNLL